MTAAPTLLRRLLLPLVLAAIATAQGQDDRPHRAVKDPELQGAINLAIQNGIAYLEKAQAADGSWTYDRFNPLGRKSEGGDDATGGLTALALYALAASGVPKTAPAISKGLAWVERHPSPYVEGRYATYSTSLLVLALTRIDAVEHRRWVHRLAERIADSQLLNGQWTYRLRSRYAEPKSAAFARSGDNSNSQFAVLALWAAEAMSGFDVPRKIWQKIQAFYAGTQQESGGWTYREPTTGAGGKGDARAGAVTVKPTMTAAGLVSYVYATAALHGGIVGLAKARKSKVADLGVRAFIEDRPKWQWTSYYLVYGIERVGTVLGLPEVSWYHWGARQLVAQQAGDGRFAGRGRRGGDPHGDGAQVYETALALLFLSKATSYPITPRDKRSP